MGLTMEQMKANRKAWAEALRSGKYKQTSGKLKRQDGSMCCLGILAEIAGCDWTSTRQSATFYAADGEINFAPQRAVDFVGLRSVKGAYEYGVLANINDAGAPFERIADIIDSEPTGLFVESVP